MVSNVASRMKVAPTDESLTSFGGLMLVAKYAEVLGLPATLDASLDSLKQRDRGYRPSEVILSLAMLHISGGCCLDDVRRLEADPCARRLMGGTGLPSAATLGTYLRRFTHREIATLMRTVGDLGKRSLDEWCREDTSDRAVLDFDSSLIQAKKQEAKK